MGRAAAALAVAAGVMASPVAAVPRAPAAALSSLESGVLADINATRARHGLAPLRLSPTLTFAARQHTEEMARDGYFAHASADGSSFWQRVRAFYGSSSWQLWSVGENLLWRSPELGPAQALVLWLASPKHRENILDPGWREIGVAAVHVTDAPGVFGGREVTIVTTDFGARR